MAPSLPLTRPAASCAVYSSHNASVGFLIDAGGIATLADCKVSNTYDAALRFGILVRGTGTKAMIARCDVFGKGQGYVVDDGAQAQVTDSSAETHEAPDSWRYTADR